MREIYPEKYSSLKKMFYVICAIAIVQWFIIGYLIKSMEWIPFQLHDQNKRILEIENRLTLE